MPRLASPLLLALAGLVAFAGSAGCMRAAPEQLRAPAQGPDHTILDNVRATDALSALADALDAAGLADALDAPGPFTLFAPTDAAFAALPDRLRSRMAPGSPQQYNVLAYHIAPALVTTAEFDGRSVRTLNGAALRVERNGDVATVNRQPILRELPAGNGVIYLIGAVLIPPGAQE